MYERLLTELATIQAAGGMLYQARGRVHVPLPRDNRWLELVPAELEATRPDLWAAGRGPGWEGRDWPGGERIVGGEWEVLTWVLGRVGAGKRAGPKNSV